MGAVLLVAGAVVVALRLKLNLVRKAAILACAVAAPLIVHDVGVGNAFARQDITHLVGTEGLSLSTVWSSDGLLVTNWLTDSKQSVVNILTIGSIILPARGSYHST